ncbi:MULTISPECIES: hypothetical protein [Pseudomonas]|uniref:Uncharacterized protein n=4 Tax=Pseudomonas syringae group genomosp. 2 TaxID=251698 RepID=A0AAX1VRC0_PSEAJ|nr:MULTISPECIES: hypothetical protein [Pseudomonas syringae group genomosp. 2]KPC02965.1 Uncharacterized protein AC501_2277 [Pseudomonas amygdali pv. lachrymans]KPX54356.1 Uncharacterized protein ALO67_03545 [Pseudomonas amygdali pv. hibisci]KPX70811.1 Uncharacterized protein ALO35_03329 [Pseudomonas amygdali pv. lachrymans]KPY77385.1 Uncharacterized protein ALO60_00973 [Pseudomonas amygdali pv. tabaci]RML77745.1 hypothetical protein ALQ89_02983 [Pseudomonas amygdali pv. tabaci]
MSRTGARDRARRQLTETLVLLSESVALLGKSRSLIEQFDTPNAAQYLADLDAFCCRPFPAQVDQHPDNQAVDMFAAAMKTKLAEARAKGRYGWSESSIQNKQLAELLIGHIPKGNAVNFEDIANFAMMLHQRRADPMELKLAFNKSKLGQDLMARIERALEEMTRQITTQPANQQSEPVAWDVLSSRGSWCKTVRGRQTALAAEQRGFTIEPLFRRVQPVLADVDERVMNLGPDMMQTKDGVEPVTLSPRASANETRSVVDLKQVKP